MNATPTAAEGPGNPPRSVVVELPNPVEDAVLPFRRHTLGPQRFRQFGNRAVPPRHENRLAEVFRIPEHLSPQAKHTVGIGGLSFDVILVQGGGKLAFIGLVDGQPKLRRHWGHGFHRSFAARRIAGSENEVRRGERIRTILKSLR